jgi:DNA-binding MarR family transcriptional regulator
MTGNDLSTADNEAKITLGLLNVIEENSDVSQRSMASDLGIALGLANAYLKRCIKKGLVKVRQAPANRYVYYLTPQGFAEKSRLTAEFLSQSFQLFRESRGEMGDLLARCQTRGWRRVALYGLSDLAEIVLLCARDHDVDLVGVVGEAEGAREYAGLAVLDAATAREMADAVIICDLSNPQAAYDAARARFAAERVLAPRLLHVSKRGPNQEGIADEEAAS